MGLTLITDCGNAEIERGLFTYEQLDGELDRVQHRLREIDRLHENGRQHRDYYQERERVLLAKIDKHFSKS